MDGASRESGKVTAHDKRMEIMGIGLWEKGQRPTPFQQRVRTIVLAGPLPRKFKDERMVHKENDLFELCGHFVLTADPEKVVQFAKAMVALDSQLSAAQDTTYLDRLEP